MLSYHLLLPYLRFNNYCIVSCVILCQLLQAATVNLALNSKDWIKTIFTTAINAALWLH